MWVYIVDSNFFIQAHRDSYPLDVVHSFWNKVKQLAHEGKIISIDKVKNEIYDKNDELETWCKNNLPDNFFKSTSELINEYRQVLQWVHSKHTHYLPKAINDFISADEADAYIVAYALADTTKRIIVTQEVSRPEMKSKIKIPEPCDALKVRYVRTIDMFRELGETF
ncbi:MAG TPA: DUF4411 family protein [Salinivirgaceae bacterium]|nr:DUF4411 family protein [Salinivirgaceae bacterium]HQA75485.1 DUF4411 family protein [Salinivirgaceae bacterium]